MPTLFGSQFARCLGDALTHAGWEPAGPWRWAYPELGLTARVVTESKAAVRRDGRPGEDLVGSGHADPQHAALHVARQVHAVRVAEQARRESLKEEDAARA